VQHPFPQALFCPPGFTTAVTRAASSRRRASGRRHHRRFPWSLSPRHADGPRAPSYVSRVQSSAARPLSLRQAPRSTGSFFRRPVSYSNPGPQPRPCRCFIPRALSQPSVRRSIASRSVEDLWSGRRERAGPPCRLERSRARDGLHCLVLIRRRIAAILEPLRRGLIEDYSRFDPTSSPFD